MDHAAVHRALNACEVKLQQGLEGIRTEQVAPNPYDMHADLTHCLDMIRRMREWPAERIEKAFRWLGFIQGVLYSYRVCPLEELKRMNMSVGVSDGEPS